MTTPRVFAAMLFTLVLARAASAALPPGRPGEMVQAELSFAAPYWDDRVALLWSPNDTPEHPGPVHRVRESAWHALALLLQDGPGDAERAQRALAAVADQQISAPGQPWDGTFYRFPEDDQVPPRAAAWNQYDPNWRQFIGTAFAVALERFPNRLPPALRARLLAAIEHAADGEQHDGRLKPSYTNIALMHAFLCAYAGSHCRRPDLAQVGTAFAEAVNDGFQAHGTFEEFNSPTYYGVDFYGLALWREFGPTPRMRELGAQLEAALWRDTAAFYHPALRNLCGPFDRSYGMDMTKYVSLTGLWLSLTLDAKVAPFPSPDGPMDHVHDLFFAPCAVLLGARIPADALARFATFPGEQTLSRELPGHRLATAWLGDTLMIGAEATGLSRGVDAGSQLHPVTMHWRMPSGEIGWLRLARSPRLNATAARNRVDIEAIGDTIFEIFAPGATASDVTAAHWRLPGLQVNVDADARDFSVKSDHGTLNLTYRQATRYHLETHADAIIPRAESPKL